MLLLLGQVLFSMTDPQLNYIIYEHSCCSSRIMAAKLSSLIQAGIWYVMFIFCSTIVLQNMKITYNFQGKHQMGKYHEDIIIINHGYPGGPITVSFSNYYATRPSSDKHCLTMAQWTCSLRNNIAYVKYILPLIKIGHIYRVVTSCVGLREEEPQTAHPMSFHGRLIQLLACSRDVKLYPIN